MWSSFTDWILWNFLQGLGMVWGCTGLYQSMGVALWYIVGSMQTDRLLLTVGKSSKKWLLLWGLLLAIIIIIIKDFRTFLLSLVPRPSLFLSLHCKLSPWEYYARKNWRRGRGWYGTAPTPVAFPAVVGHWWARFRTRLSLSFEVSRITFARAGRESLRTRLVFMVHAQWILGGYVRAWGRGYYWSSWIVFQ